MLWKFRKTFFLIAVCVVAAPLLLGAEYENRTAVLSPRYQLVKNGGSIQAAVQVCPTTGGCKIELEVGTYTEAITLDRSVMIEGSCQLFTNTNRSVCTILDSGTNDVATVTISSGATVVAFKNVDIVSRTINGGLEGRGVFINTTGVEVQFWYSSFTGGSGGATSRPYAVADNTAASGSQVSFDHVLLDHGMTAGGLYRGGNVRFMADQIAVSSMSTAVPVFNFVNGVSDTTFINCVRMDVNAPVVGIPSGSANLHIGCIDNQASSAKLFSYTGGSPRLWIGDLTNFEIASGNGTTGSAGVLDLSRLFTFSGTAIPRIYGLENRLVCYTAVDVTASGAGGTTDYPCTMYAPVFAATAGLQMEGSVDVTAHATSGGTNLALKFGGTTLHTISIAGTTTGSTSFIWRLLRVGTANQRSNVVLTGVGTVDVAYATSAINTLADANAVLTVNSGGAGNTISLHDATGRIQ